MPLEKEEVTYELLQNQLTRKLLQISKTHDNN